MSTSIWNLLLASSLCVALPTMALAEVPPAPPPVEEAPPPVLPDAVVRAVGDRLVVLEATDGRELTGRILAIEPGQLIISISATGQVLTVPRSSIAKMRLLTVAPLPIPAVDHEEPEARVQPSRKRYLAVNLSVAPGFDLDLDAGLFHGFINLGIILPLVNNGSIIPFSGGLGLGIPVSQSLPALKLDLFAHLNVIGNATAGTTYSPATPFVGFGVGLGLHYTWNNGLTLGFTVPVLGYALAIGSHSSSYGSGGTAAGAAAYYVTSSEALPLGFIGYRF